MSEADGVKTRKTTVEDFARMLGIHPDALDPSKVERARETVMMRWLRRDKDFGAPLVERDERESFMDGLPVVSLRSGFIGVRL